MSTLAESSLLSSGNSPDIDTTQELFLGRQPILDLGGNIVAYELLFRNSPSNTIKVADDLQATASVISRAFGEMYIHDILGKHRGFINISASLLMSDLIELLPHRRVVLELLETIKINEEIVQRCRMLKQAGFSLALDDFGKFDEAYVPLLEIVDIVKIDLTLHDNDSLIEVVNLLKRWPVKLLAEKVDSQQQADDCRSLGFELFQGYFFARPVILTGKGVDPSHLPMLKLLGLVLSDADDSEIELVFRQSPNLTFNLMRLVNSVASGLSTKISSVRQAILALGRRQLQRWLQLLLYTMQSGVEYPSPLMQLAAARGRVMESLAGKISGQRQAYRDQAFMTGLLSLLDALLNVPLSEVLRQLNIPEAINRALLHHEGELGALLNLTKQLEQNDQEGIDRLLAQFPGLSPLDLFEAEREALAWLNDLN